MKISFETNPYLPTIIKGKSIEQIKKYCMNNNLTILEISCSRFKRYTVEAQKANQHVSIFSLN